MKNVIKTILPSPVAVLLTLFLPVIASVYLIVTHYAEQVITSEETAYTVAQNQVLGKLFFSTSLIDSFNRIMDFVFWGVIAFVVMIIIWAIGYIKVTVKNHYAQEDFTNFQEDKLLWHEHFVVVIMLKIISICLIIYSVFSKLVDYCLGSRLISLFYYMILAVPIYRQ